MAPPPKKQKKQKTKRETQSKLVEVKVTVGRNYDGSAIRKSFYAPSRKQALEKADAYKLALEAKRVLSRKGVPADGRFMIVSPEYLEMLMLDEHFIKRGDLSQEMVQAGVAGKIAGFNVFESNNMDYENTTRVASKKTTTEFICGHPNWCHRVMEWQVPVHLQDLAGSGKYIGASAVQGRKVYGIKVSKPQTLYIKRTEA